MLPQTVDETEWNSNSLQMVSDYVNSLLQNLEDHMDSIEDRIVFNKNFYSIIFGEQNFLLIAIRELVRISKLQEVFSLLSFRYDTLEITACVCCIISKVILKMEIHNERAYRVMQIGYDFKEYSISQAEVSSLYKKYSNLIEKVYKSSCITPFLEMLFATMVSSHSANEIFGEKTPSLLQTADMFLLVYDFGNPEKGLEFYSRSAR